MKTPKAIRPPYTKVTGDKLTIQFTPNLLRAEMEAVQVQRSILTGKRAELAECKKEVAHCEEGYKHALTILYRAIEDSKV